MKVKITVLLILFICLLFLTQRTLAQEAFPKDDDDSSENTKTAILEKKSVELPNILEQPFIEQNVTRNSRGEENKLNDIESDGDKLYDTVTVVFETTETRIQLVTEDVLEILDNNEKDSEESTVFNTEQEQENVEAGEVVFSQMSNRVANEHQSLDSTEVSEAKDCTSEFGEQITKVEGTTETKTTMQDRNDAGNSQTDVLANVAIFQREQNEWSLWAKDTESEGELQVLENPIDELPDAEGGYDLTEKDITSENEMNSLIAAEDVAQTKDSETANTLGLKISRSNTSAPQADPTSRIELEVTQIVKSAEQTELRRSDAESNVLLIDNELLSRKTLVIEEAEVNDIAVKEDTQNCIEDCTTVVTTISNDESVTETLKNVKENEELITEKPEANNAETVTVAESAEPTTTTTTTTQLCTTPGSYAVENDCRAYITCTTTVSGELQRAHTSCPTSQAYEPELRRCSRDLSPCTDIFHCQLEGTYADPSDNTSYYWCVASRLNVAYHIYHIKCGNGQIYTSELGKCFVDMTNLQNLPLNYELYMSKSPDEECVREEIKVLRAEEKAKFKAIKLREKIQKKYEKELLKKAAKEAKEQAKLQGVSLEEEAPFICTQDGNYAAAAESFYDYFICTGQKKGKFKAIGMKCAQGQTFSDTQNMCVGN